MLEDGVLLVRGERFDRDRLDFECSGFRRPGAVASSNEGFLKEDWVGGGSCLEAGMAGGLREAICAVVVAVVFVDCPRTHGGVVRRLLRYNSKACKKLEKES